MKTLDEVIKANECCDHGEPDSRCEDCPYNGVGSCCLERENDALHYLKVLKDILDPLKVKKITHEITCPQCNSVIAILLPESNEPLTWDELKTMTGKPVWVECKFYSHQWAIIGEVYENRIRFYGHRLVDGEPRSEIGETWQAYRKER